MRGFLLVLLCTGILVTPAFSDEPEGVTLILLYTSDLRGNFEQMLGVASVARQVRQDGGQVLLLDSGNALSPSEAAFTHPGREGSLTVEMMNRAGYDGWVLGRGDLDRGLDELTEFLRGTRFPVLGANLHRPDTGRLLFQVQPYAIVHRRGIGIGVLGVSAGDGGVLRGDPGAAARYYVPLLQARADVVMAVTHLGFEADSLLAVSVPEIDVIVDGALPPGREISRQINGVLICGGRGGGGQVGRIDVVVTDGKVQEGAFHTVSAEVSPGEAATALAGWTAEVDGKSLALTDVLGTSAGGFGGVAVGHLIADLMRTATASDMAFVLAPHVGPALPEGPIRVLDLYRVYGWPHRLAAAFLRGAQVYTLLERGLTASGPLFYVSGVEVVYDRAAPEGKRVASATVGGEPLDREKVYRVAIEEGTAGSGGIEGIAEILRPVERRENGVRIRDLLARYIQTAGVVRGTAEVRTQVR